MKGKIFFILAFEIFTLTVISAETTIPGGNVSGTWYKANSPYKITGNISIPVNNSLIIEPGVQVNFQGYYSLTVNGLLEAVGTETDSIHFFPADINVRWGGIRFENAPDSSHLAYCTVSYTGTIFLGRGGIICTNSNPVIIHCRISNNYNRADVFPTAGGIALNNSNAKISWCNISNNFSNLYGGGINIYNSNPEITGCNISGNEAIQYGGGIFIDGTSDPVITKCTIERNLSNMYGGGITSRSMGTISECLIGNNNADDGGGGISIHSGSLSIDHCILGYNKCYTSQGKGGGIYTAGGAVMVDHCNFFGNEVFMTPDAKGQEIHTEGIAAITITNSIIISLWNYQTIVFGSSSPASVSYSDFLCMVGIPTNNYFYGNMPSGLGEITTTNNNGDPSDVYYNIFKDPLFENPSSGNFQITWSNFPANDETKSPCIDAGDPAFTDPDQTISDIGALFYSQPPGADFEADTTQGEVPLTVQFNDKSIGELTSWLWDFGDGNTSTEGNPSYTYNIAGVYTVKLTVSGPKGTDSETKTDYITASDITNIETEEMGDILRIYPNPANISCSISLSLIKSDNVKLAVYNSKGQMVRIIFEGSIPAEIYYLEEDISDLPGGIYFISVSTDSWSKTRELIITK